MGTETMQQLINKQSSKFECCEVLSGDDIVINRAYSLKWRKNWKNIPENDAENLVTHQTLSYDVTLLHTEALVITWIKNIKADLLKEILHTTFAKQ